MSVNDALTNASVDISWTVEMNGVAFGLDLEDLGLHLTGSTKTGT